MIFYNKKGLGLTGIALAITLSLITLVPITKWFLDINSSVSATKIKLELANLATQKAKELDNTPIETIYSKIGTSDKETVAGRYDVRVDYNNKVYDSNKGQYYIPTTLSITDKADSKNNYSITRKTYDTSDNVKNPDLKYLLNDDYPSRKLAIGYDEENKEMSFWADGKKVSHTEANFSEGTGYINFTNGLIIQWGTSTGNNSIAFPIPFKHTCFNALSTVSTTGAPSYVYGWNNSSMNIETYGRKVSWIALGY